MLEITPTICQPEKFCSEVRDIVQSEMLANDIIFNFVIKEGYKELDIDWVEADPSRVNQVVRRPIKLLGGTDIP
jgi:signal transduction histidine kinase